ncbi:MAG: HAMP domain-containing protein [Candidatus Cloacimonetes bacterium]|nr:HAMP domain-containing protein [Candidatus Cloacimonadota bacterium]
MKIRENLGLKISFSLALIMIVVTGAIAYYLIRTQTSMLETEIMKKVETLTTIGSQIMEVKLEMGVELEYFSIEEAFDTTYVAIAGTNPLKYNTRTDSYFDQNIQGIEDSFLKDDGIVYAILVDRNGYCPTHNSIYTKPITGNQEVDLLGNRTKRIFNDPVGLKAARNTKGFLKQHYTRDTGELLWDLSMPVYFVGEHWGAFRIGYSIDKMTNHIKSLTYSLMFVMIFLIVLLSLLIFFFINRSMSELRRITNIASHMADGNLTNEVQTKSRDEIGRLADVLERMRISLKLSIEELKKMK